MARIGLALGGGAGLGWAHIGVMRALEQEDIEVDVVAGTSIGAIVGACVAGDMLDELEDLARDVTMREVLSLSQFGFTKGSLMGADKIERKLREYFGTLGIEDLRKPFAAVAADLYSGEAIVLDEGDVVTALRASSAIPGVLPPVRTNHLYLVDGGIVDPVPVQVARDLGADVIIAVDLQGDYPARAKRLGFDPLMKKPSMAALKSARAGWSLALMALSQAKLAADKPDIVITPRIGHIDMANFTQAEELIALGHNAALTVMPDILQLFETV
ncbi:MAG: Patatin [Kordiimonadales bacterium]|nr:MAG: Patatin [Kordiimonadales bacterium]